MMVSFSEEKKTWTLMGRGHRMPGRETGVTWPQAREYWGHHKPERQEGPSPQASEGAGPAHTSISAFWPPDRERVNFRWCEPPGLWSPITKPQETHPDTHSEGPSQHSWFSSHLPTCIHRCPLSHHPSPMCGQPSAGFSSPLQPQPPTLLRNPHVHLQPRLQCPTSWSSRTRSLLAPQTPSTNHTPPLPASATTFLNLSMPGPKDAQGARARS